MRDRDDDHSATLVRYRDKDFNAAQLPGFLIIPYPRQNPPTPLRTPIAYSFEHPFFRRKADRRPERLIKDWAARRLLCPLAVTTILAMFICHRWHDEPTMSLPTHAGLPRVAER